MASKLKLCRNGVVGRPCLRRFPLCEDSRSWRVRRELCLIWIADAHRDGKRFVVHADEKLTAFLELEAAIHSRGELS